MKLPRGWIRTDDLQWRRDLNFTEFQLVEVRDYPDGYCVVEATISLDEYSEDDIYRYISGYYDSVSEIREQYGDEANGVIAECIFEQMGCEEMNNQIRLYDSEEEAERQAICLINVLTQRKENNMNKNANEINRNFRIAEYKKFVKALSELNKKSPMDSAMDKEEKEAFEGLVRVILGYGFKAGFDGLAGVCEEILLERRVMNRILHPKERSCEFYNSLSDEEKMYFLSSVYDNYHGAERMDDYEEIEYAVNEAMCDMKGDDYDD